MSPEGATLTGAPRPVRRLVRAMPVPRRIRLRLVASLAFMALLTAGYFLWLRESSLVRVRTVTVTGLSGAGSDRIRTALSGTARNMTTLHVDRAELERAAAAFPVLRAIEVRPDFPHGMRIHVLQHRPAALLVSGTRRVPVAGDGTVLAGVAAPAGLPLIRAGGDLPARSVPPGSLLARVRVAGGLPAALRSRVGEIEREGRKGVVVPLDGGPKLVFGDGTRVAAKWAAAARVLADPDATGAAYVDVRIPERPVAGGLPAETVVPVAPAQAPSAAAPGAPAAAGSATGTPAERAAPVAPVAPGSAAPAPPAGAGSPAAPLAPAPPLGQVQEPSGTGGGALANPRP